METYLLFKSESESSWTLVPSTNQELIADLPDDAINVWSVQAKSWEIACLKRNEFLNWDAYKPHIHQSSDLIKFIPIDKFDLDNAQLLINLGFPENESVLLKLFEWIQDANWPIAYLIIPYLASLGYKCRKQIEFIMKTKDGMWKYWVIQEVIAKMEIAEAEKYVPVLLKLQSRLTKDDKDNEVDLAIQEILDSFT